MINHIKTMPILSWLKWYIKTKILLFKNRGKKIEIYKNVHISESNLSLYNSFYPDVSIHKCNIGKCVYVSGETIIIQTNIGNFCSIGPRCKIGLGMHPINDISTFPAFFSTAKQCRITFVEEDLFVEQKEINIGNDVWVGANVTILDGVKIGDGAIIAAGAVVTKDVEPYSIVGGVPAKFIKKRFSEEEIKKLLDFKWWNKDIDWINKNRSLFNEPSLFFERINNL